MPVSPLEFSEPPLSTFDNGGLRSWWALHSEDPQLAERLFPSHLFCFKSLPENPAFNQGTKQDPLSERSSNNVKTRRLTTVCRALSYIPPNIWRQGLEDIFLFRGPGFAFVFQTRDSLIPTTGVVPSRPPPFGQATISWKTFPAAYVEGLRWTFCPPPPLEPKVEFL